MSIVPKPLVEDIDENRRRVEVDVQVPAFLELARHLGEELVVDFSWAHCGHVLRCLE